MKLQYTTKYTQHGATFCSVCERPYRSGDIACDAYNVRGRIGHGADAPQFTAG